MDLSEKVIFQTAVDRYGKSLYWHIRRLVVSHDDAEDALQETFMKIFSKASTFRGEEANLKAWCYKIATNEAMQLLRKRARAFQSIDSVGRELSERLVAESAPDANKSSILFQQAILRLSTQQRIAFNLRYYDELPYSQIAAITGKSGNTMRTNYHYAVEKIKDYLKENAI